MNQTPQKSDVFHASFIVDAADKTKGEEYLTNMYFIPSIGAAIHTLMETWGEDIGDKEVYVDIFVDRPGTVATIRKEGRERRDRRCNVQEKLPKALTQDYLYNVAMVAGRQLVMMAAQGEKLDGKTLRFMLDVKAKPDPEPAEPNALEKSKLLYLEGSVTDAITDLLNYNRKNDEELSARDVEMLIEKGLLTRSSLKKVFSVAIEQAFDEDFKGEEEVYKSQTGI